MARASSGRVRKKRKLPEASYAGSVAIPKLKWKRRIRIAKVVGGAIFGTVTGLVVSRGKPGGVILGSVVGGTVGFGVSAKSVRRATLEVGQALSHEVKHGNKELKNLLENYPYVIVNQKGEIVGKKTKALGIGRMRLSSKAILRDQVRMEKATPKKA